MGVERAGASEGEPAVSPFDGVYENTTPYWLDDPIVDLELRAGNLAEALAGRYDVDVSVEGRTKSGDRMELNPSGDGMYPAGVKVEIEEEDQYIRFKQQQKDGGYRLKVTTKNVPGRRRLKETLELIEGHVLNGHEARLWDEFAGAGGGQAQDVESVLEQKRVAYESKTWADIVLDDDTREDVENAIVEPIEQPELYAAAGFDPEPGVVLHGPPGTGKTLLAKVVASESDAELYRIKTGDLMKKYVGESPQAVESLYEAARQEAGKQDRPVILFFDEFDTLGRGRDVDETHEVTGQIVTSLLDELDGMEELDDVLTLAATNNIEQVDDALLRSGRLGKKIGFGYPDTDAREKILETHLRHLEGKDAVSVQLDYGEIAERTKGWTGADLESLARESALHAARNAEDVGNWELSMAEIEAVWDSVERNVDKASEAEPDQNRDTRVGIQ